MKTDKVNPGIFSLISRATVWNSDGDRHCLSVNVLRKAAASSAPATLAVPPWAMQRVTEHGNDMIAGSKASSRGNLQYRSLGLAAQTIWRA